MSKKSLILPGDGLPFPDALDYFVDARVASLTTNRMRMMSRGSQYGQALEAVLEAQHQFRQALPEALKSQWLALDDAEARLGNATADAAYRLGLQDGLRMGLGGLMDSAGSDVD